MAITDISIQDYKVGDSDLLAVHSPLTFLIDVTYSGVIPDILYCDVYDEDSVLLVTLKCIPYQDLTPTERRFIFIADSIIRGYMNEFDDFVQTENSFVHVPDITKIFELKFRDPDAGVSDEPAIFTAIQSAREFGENPNLTEIFNNEPQDYIAAKDEPAYVYFYNDNTTNILTIGESGGDSFIAKFIISDTGGLLDGALIQIDGESEETNTDGEATFALENGTYAYTIYKEGYQEKNGNLEIDGSNLLLEIELTINTEAIVTFHAEYNSVDQENVFIEIKKGEILIASGYTNSNGDLVKTLFLDTYDIEVSNLYWEYEVAPYELVVASTPITDNLVITLKDTYAVTFFVTDLADVPLVGANIGNLDYALSGDPNDTWRNQAAILVTGGDGKVTVDDLPGSDIAGIRKTGYSTVTTSISTTTAPYEKQIKLSAI